MIATADGIVKKAKIRQKKVADVNPNQSKAKQLGNIAKNQAAEKAAGRAGFLGSETPAITPQAPDAGSSNIFQAPQAKTDILLVTAPIESAFTKKLLAKLKQHQAEKGKT